MGQLKYGQLTVHVEARTLAHLQIVILQKLRRGESFLLSWKDSAQAGGGRSSVWLHPAIPLYFEFPPGAPCSVDPLWVAELTLCANSAQGLVIRGEAYDAFPAPSMTGKASPGTSHPASKVHRPKVRSR